MSPSTLTCLQSWSDEDTQMRTLQRSQDSIFLEYSEQLRRYSYCYGNQLVVMWAIVHCVWRRWETNWYIFLRTTHSSLLLPKHCGDLEYIIFHSNWWIYFARESKSFTYGTSWRASSSVDAHNMPLLMRSNESPADHKDTVHDDSYREASFHASHILFSSCTHWNRRVVNAKWGGGGAGNEVMVQILTLYLN